MRGVNGDGGHDKREAFCCSRYGAATNGRCSMDRDFLRLLAVHLCLSQALLEPRFISPCRCESHTRCCRSQGTAQRTVNYAVFFCALGGEQVASVDVVSQLAAQRTEDGHNTLPLGVPGGQDTSV